MALSERSRTDLDEVAALYTFICVLVRGRTLENPLDQISPVSLTHSVSVSVYRNVCEHVYGF